MPQLNVLVVGASIAGPTAAYWLAKTGVKVTVIERFPELRTSGQNVDIRLAGVTVMRKMPGMEAAVRAKRWELDGISIVRSDGRPYGVIKPSGNPDKQSLISEYEILRGDLGKILYDITASHKNVEYVFGEQVASIQQNPNEDGPVTVEFTGKLPTTQFDLVVACDGATSRTRAIGLDCGVRDHTVSLNSWAAFCTLDKDFLNGSKVGHAYSAVGGRFMGAGHAPGGGNRVAFMGIKPQSDSNSILPFREAMKRGEEAVKEYVYEYYHGAGWKCDEILECMMKSKDFYAHEFMQVKLPALSNGRFVLVGDAGYAPGPTGTGTTIAMAGAYVLAGEVCKHKGDISKALEGYETEMRPLIKEMQKVPSFFSTILGPQTAWGLWLRNHIFAFLCWIKLVEIIEKFFGAAFSSAESYPLPEYEWVE
ncbi:hypothetical protein N7456_003812 [Penicillium angulare]|uniref:FAD-binding domain-containing protein n=1 Tax=Penicillium angulare TaxID=116970 RepID=A0A9W9FX26_9EURO|nr:hypothetical protein N7456_003812 [Penicillium angulare]